MFWQGKDLLSNLYDDVGNEFLQTDIQRFMAIMGFCLMAIFALVQAIPVTNPEKDMVIEDLHHNADLQKTELEHLKSENKRLIKETDRLMQYEGIDRSRQKELDKARKELIRQREEIDRLNDEKITHQEDLMELKKLLSKRDKEIRELKIARERVKQIMEKAIEKIEDLVRLEKKPDLGYRRPAEGKSLYVAFESDSVFLNLLGSGKISLVIKVVGMERGFRVMKKDGGIDFAAGIPVRDLDLWEVKEHMVPFEILEAFRAWTTLSSREKMFIVGLTPEISRQIRGKRVSSGRFIIKEEGSVVYSPDGE